MRFLLARLLALLAILALASLPSAATPREDGAAEWLKRLASGSATERDRARRWLGANLELDDYPELAASARDADAETSRRLIDVLGADGAYLGLVALLLTDREPVLKTIGEGAFDELVARWCPGAAAKSAFASDIVEALSREARFDLVVEPATEELEAGIDRLARLGGLGVPLVLDPASAAEPFEHRGYSGTVLEILSEVVKERRLAVTGIGEWEGELPGAGAWVLISTRGGAFRQSGVERLRRWVVTVERGGTGAASCARALGACGWPAATRWLDRRWSTRGDRQALEGVLVAAERGRVSRSLLRHTERLRLLESADRGLAARSPAGRLHAERVARALARAGAMSLGGEDRGVEFLEGWAELAPGERWLRLVVVEGQRSSRPELRDRLLEGIEREATLTPALRFQALRALAAPARRPLRSVTPAGIPELVRWARATGAAEELVVLFGALSVRPPETGAGATEVPRILLADWTLRLGDAEAFVALLARPGGLPDPARDVRLSAGDSWSAHFRRWSQEQGPTRLRELVDSALALAKGGDRQRLLHLALLGGCLGDDGQREVFESVAEERRSDPLRYELLGALCGGPERTAARAALLASLRTLPAGPEAREALVRGLDRAVAALTETRRDRRADELMETVWAAAWSDEHPLHDRLAPLKWPGEIAPIVVELRRQDRVLPASLRR